MNIKGLKIFHLMLAKSLSNINIKNLSEDRTKIMNYAIWFIYRVYILQSRVVFIVSSCFTYVTTGRMVSTHCTEQRDYYREKYCGPMRKCFPIILLSYSTKYSFMHLILVRENKREAIWNTLIHLLHNLLFLVLCTQAVLNSNWTRIHRETT